MSDYSLTKSRTLQWAAILLILISGTGAYFYFRSKAAGTMTTSSSNARPDFEAPLKSDLNLTAGTGTATYSRADGADGRATITDFEGLIRPVRQNEARFEGARRVENLVTYSEALDNAAWVKGSGVTVDANVASAPDGTMTADRINLGSNADLNVFSCAAYSGVSVPLRSFIATVYVKAESSADIGKNIKIDVRRASGTWVSALQTITLTGGWQRVSTGTLTTLSDTVGLKFYIGQSASNYPASVLAWGGQIEEVTGQSNQNPSEYVSTNVKTAFPYHGAGVDGVKYFDYQNGNTVASNVVTEATGTAIPEATLKGYLSEGSRVNLVTYSEQIDNAAWYKDNVSVSANVAVAPDGKTAADKLVESAVTNIHRIYQYSTHSTGVVVTGSIYLKAAERNYAKLSLWNATDATIAAATINLTNGATSNTTGTVSVISLPNGWYRLVMSGTAAAGTSTGFHVNVMYDATISSYLGDGSSGIYAWGTQFEQAAFASSYIPTTSASVTRARDSLRYVGSENFNNTAGTVSIEATTEWTGGSGFDTYFIDDSATSQRMAIWHWGGSTNHLAVDRNGGGGTRNNYDYSSLAITAGTAMKLTQRWTSTAHSLFRDGSLRGSDTTLTLPYDAISGIGVGCRFVSNGEAYSFIKNVRVWKQAMSDTFLQNLTAEQLGVIKQTNNRVANNTGLVGHWSFDEGSGTGATDFSPSGMSDGTLINGPTWTNGRFGKALNFDGATQYVSIPDNGAILDPSSITISAWIKPSSCATGDFVSKGWNSGYRIRTNASTCAITFFDRGMTNSIATSAAVPIGSWSHIVATGDSSGLKIYINGSLSVSNTTSYGAPNTASALLIGSEIAYSEYFPGQIDDVRIYGRSLSQAEISTLYQSSSAKINVSHNDKLTNGLVGLWSFNGPDLSGTTAYDRSGGGNNGTLMNGPSVIPGKIGQALSFDGTTGRVDYDTNLGSSVTTEMTVSAWVKPTAAPAGVGRVVASTYYYNARPSNERGWLFGSSFGSASDFMFYVRDSAGTSTGYTTSGTFFSTYLNQWSHVVGVFKGGQYMQLYVNGSKVNEDMDGIPSSIAYDAATHLRIGMRADSLVQGQWQGAIDEVRIYNRALSTSEITALYDMGR